MTNPYIKYVRSKVLQTPVADMSSHAFSDVLTRLSNLYKLYNFKFTNYKLLFEDVAGHRVAPGGLVCGNACHNAVNVIMISHSQ